MPSEKTTGSQVAVIDTEHTLLDSTDAGVYQLIVDMTNMANGDTVILREYLAVQTGEAAVLHNSYSVSHAQEEIAVSSFPIPIVHRFKYTLEQTEGTARTFDWSIVQLDS